MIGLPLRSSTSKTRDGTSITRTQAISYDANGLLKTPTVEPDDAAYTVTTAHERSNAYGLVGRTTQAWRNPASGQAEACTVQEVLSFEPRCRFVETSKNVLGHMSTART